MDKAAVDLKEIRLRNEQLRRRFAEEEADRNEALAKGMSVTAEQSRNVRTGVDKSVRGRLQPRGKPAGKYEEESLEAEEDLVDFEYDQDVQRRNRGADYAVHFDEHLAAQRRVQVRSGGPQHYPNLVVSVSSDKNGDERGGFAYGGGRRGKQPAASRGAPAQGNRPSVHDRLGWNPRVTARGPGRTVPDRDRQPSPEPDCIIEYEHEYRPEADLEPERERPNRRERRQEGQPKRPDDLGRQRESKRYQNTHSYSSNPRDTRNYSASNRNEPRAAQPQSPENDPYRLDGDFSSYFHKIVDNVRSKQQDDSPVSPTAPQPASPPAHVRPAHFDTSAAQQHAKHSGGADFAYSVAESVINAAFGDPQQFAEAESPSDAGPAFYDRQTSGTSNATYERQSSASYDPSKQPRMLRGRGVNPAQAAAMLEAASDVDWYNEVLREQQERLAERGSRNQQPSHGHVQPVRPPQFPAQANFSQNPSAQMAPRPVHYSPDARFQAPPQFPRFDHPAQFGIQPQFQSAPTQQYYVPPRLQMQQSQAHNAPSVPTGFRHPQRTPQRFRNQHESHFNHPSSAAPDFAAIERANAEVDLRSRLGTRGRPDRRRNDRGRRRAPEKRRGDDDDFEDVEEQVIVGDVAEDESA